MMVVFIDQLSWLGIEAFAASAAQQHALRNPMPITMERSFMVTPLDEVVRSGAGRRGRARSGYDEIGCRRARPGNRTFVLLFRPPVKGAQRLPSNRV